ncbi:Transposon Ty3-I Gag-Pol polyprotein, partial [Linum perenne]
MINVLPSSVPPCLRLTVTRHEVFSIMDCYSGYNQIYIANDDIHKTAFRCPGAIGCYEWVVMPFGLKNDGRLINE